MKLAVCGHANLDVQLVVQELPRDGNSTPILERRVVWGGTGANIARHAASLGVPTRLWSRVGTDFPPAWRKALETTGVDLAHLDVAPGQATPTCFVLTDLVDQQAYCMDQGPMASMAAAPPSHQLLDGLGHGDWLHVGTGDPAAYGALVRQAKQKGLFVAFDPGQELRFLYDEHDFEALLNGCSLFFCNEAELDVALRLLSYGDAVQLLDHAEAVIVTRGPKGATLYRPRKKPLDVPAFPAQVIDPTGAGDAFRAGWYAGLQAGKPFDEALRWAAAAGAVKVGRATPQDKPVTPSDLASLVGAPGSRRNLNP